MDLGRWETPNNPVLMLTTHPLQAAGFVHLLYTQERELGWQYFSILAASQSHLELLKITMPRFYPDQLSQRIWR